MSDPGLAAAYAAAVERQAARKGLGLKQIESIRQQYVTIADQKIEAAGDDEEDLAQAKAVKAYYLQQIAFWYQWIFGTQVTGLAKSDDDEFRFELGQAESMDAWVRGVSGGKPSLPELLRVASAWQIAGDEERCMEVLDEAMANPDATEQGRYAAMVQLGYVMLRSDDPDCERAISIFEQASALRPSEPTVKNNLAYAIASCDGDLEAALPLSLDVVASEPDNAAYRDTLGEIYWRMHEETEAGTLEGFNTADLLAKAAQEFQNALEINPIKVQSWIHLARVHLVRDECGEARNALTKAGDSDPTLSEQSQIDRLMEVLGECGKG
jgi:tetratricopeptide (TPR) repeat protein